MSRGHDRERSIQRLLELEGWVTVRAAGSLGPVDVVALRDCQALLIESKSTAGGPYERFGPADRTTMIAIALRAGAVPLLCHWPKHQRARWIPAPEWPRAVIPLTLRAFEGQLPIGRGEVQQLAL